MFGSRTLDSSSSGAESVAGTSATGYCTPPQDLAFVGPALLTLVTDRARGEKEGRQTGRAAHPTDQYSVFGQLHYCSRAPCLHCPGAQVMNSLLSKLPMPCTQQLACRTLPVHKVEAVKHPQAPLLYTRRMSGSKPLP